MIRKLIFDIIKGIIFSAIPATLSYMANSTLVYDYLISIGVMINPDNIPIIQDYCLWVGISLSSVFIFFNLIYIKRKSYFYLEQRNNLIKMNKKVLSSALGKNVLFDSASFNIRIFVPTRPLYYKLMDKLKCKKYSKKFIIKNIDLISDAGITRNLKFEVYPNPQGLVGMCYDLKSIVYDDNLEENNENAYQLTKYQISKTSDLKWIICCPILDENENVISIISLDGKTKLSIDDTKLDSLKNILPAFSVMLYEAVPEFFKWR